MKACEKKPMYLSYQPNGVGDLCRQIKMMASVDIAQDSIYKYAVSASSIKLLSELGVESRMFCTDSKSSFGKLLTLLRVIIISRINSLVLITSDLGYGNLHLVLLSWLARILNVDYVILKRKNFPLPIVANSENLKVKLAGKRVFIHYGCDPRNFKKLPSSNFIFLLASVLKSNSIVLIFGPNDRIPDELKHLPIRLMKGLKDYLEIRNNSVVIHFDSGVGHICSMLNIETVCIGGPTEVLETAPFSQFDSVALPEIECFPCYKNEGHLRCRDKACFYSSLLEFS